MRKILMSLAAVCAACSVMAADAPQKLKVLMIGNSFSICVLKEMPKVAASMGFELDLASLYIGGCSLERHWKNVESDRPDFKPYRFDRDTGNRRVVDDGKINIPEALKLDRWDIVTIQQASHFSWKPETYDPFGEKLIAKIRELAPQAEVVVQETWSYTPWDKRLGEWKMDPAQMYEKLHRAYGDYAAAKKLRVIPMGTVVQEYRKALPVVYSDNSFGGDPCGSAKFQQDAEGKWTPKGDVFHLNHEGHYLQGLVWTAALFRADVAKCAYAPKDIDPARVAVMRRVVSQVVNSNKP